MEKDGNIQEDVELVLAVELLVEEVAVIQEQALEMAAGGYGLMKLGRPENPEISL
jgi:hypothetical protein